MLPSAVLTHLNAGVLAACGPEPVTIAECLQPASVTAAKHFKPSERTTVPLSSAVLASLRSADLLNAPTRRRMILRGLPSSVVSTAATKGVLPTAPRPGGPARSPPKYASSI